jgi:hypothetical protein
MHSTHLILPLLLATGLAWSQTPTAAPATTPASAAAPKTARTGIEPRVEHIQVEDSAARIDELRVGGETQSISVQPKSGMPAYQVEPKTGERTWKVLGF